MVPAKVWEGGKVHAVLKEDLAGGRLPSVRKSLPTGVIPILLPGQVKPVKKIQSIRQDCHQQDPGRREVIGQKPDSHSHYRSRFSRLPTGYGCSKGRAAVPAELLGRFRFSTAIGTEWHTE